MLDKCILKIKIHPMRLSGSHGICRIKVMMPAFLATLIGTLRYEDGKARTGTAVDARNFRGSR